MAAKKYFYIDKISFIILTQFIVCVIDNLVEPLIMNTVQLGCVFFAHKAGAASMLGIFCAAAQSNIVCLSA
ncbi:MAG: hypothetical protein ACI82S_002499 [Patiriisocius sp.]